MYLLDTNHCSSIVGGNPNILRQIQNKGSVLVASCVVVQGELLFMAENSQQKTANLTMIQAFPSGIFLYPIDSKAANIYGKLKAEILNYFGPKDKQKRRRTKVEELGISDNDLWIAAIALSQKLIIVSADKDFTRIQQVSYLVVESWLD